jgi:hypothetical protein
MKRLLMGLFAVGLVLALALPAAAVDNEFGGFWRTRAYMQDNFSGDDAGSNDLRKVDTRTRLFYTAIFSDDFKFVNRFEYNLTWGTSPVNGAAGEISSSTANRSAFRLKQSYAYFNLGQVNFMVGLQPRIIHRGFLFDADFTGLSITYNGDGVSIPFIWMKSYEGESGKDANDSDVDIYSVKPTLTFGNATLTPTLTYLYSKDAGLWSGSVFKEMGVWFAGLDADVKFSGGSSLWFTGIYTGGAIDIAPAYVSSFKTDKLDVGGYLVAAGGTMNMGAMDIHGQAFYATGDDDATVKDYEGFSVPQGQMYYWSEIMGLGIFDNQASANSPADKINNIMAANIGLGFKASDKLSFKADLWYAKLAEDNSAGDSVLGTEIDLQMTYVLMKNLNLDVVAAYLLAGDATYKKVGTGADQADATEIGTKLSFTF